LKTFWAIALVLLVWNLAGLVAFIVQVRSDPGDLGDAVTAEAFATMPAWTWCAYAVATIAGTAGALALLKKRKVAWLLFALSLTGVILQFGWTILGFGILERKGAGAIVFPFVIALMAVLGTTYCRYLTKHDVLR